MIFKFMFKDGRIALRIMEEKPQGSIPTKLLGDIYFTTSEYIQLKKTIKEFDK